MSSLDQKIKRLEEEALKAKLTYERSRDKFREELKQLRIKTKAKESQKQSISDRRASLPPPETDTERRNRILNSIKNSKVNVTENENDVVGARVVEVSGQPVLPPQTPVMSCRLPEVKIEPFSGNVLEFPAWEIAFNALIENRVSSVAMKINLLSQYLCDEARSLVLGLLCNYSEDSYKAARKRLKQRYGNPTIISQAFLDKLHNWPSIKPNQAKELQQFSDLLIQIAEIKKNVSALGILDFPQETKMILAKLPSYVENEWRKSVCSWRELYSEGSYPSFDYFVEFIERCATRANIPELQNIARISQHRRGGFKVATALTTNISKHAIICKFCSKDHSINECDAFSALTRDDCLKFLKENQLCFGCGASSRHLARNCTNRSKCKICGKLHLSCLHVETSKEASSRRTEVGCDNCEGNVFDNSMILPVYIREKNNPTKEKLCYCILDDQSNTCFISKNCRRIWK